MIKALRLGRVFAVFFGIVIASCAPSEKARAADEPVEIIFWQALGKRAIVVLDDIIVRYHARQSKYRIKTVIQGDYNESYQRLQAAIAGNSAPNLVLLNNDKSYILNQKGLLEHFTLSGPDRDDFMETFFKQGVSATGDIFALPAFGATQVMYYNKEVFRLAGVDAAKIRTWQQLSDAARRMTKREDGKTVFYGWEPMWKYENLMDAALGNGGKFLSDDGRTVLINSAEWVEVWESFRKWIHEDEIMRIHFGGQGWEYWYKTIDDVMEDSAAGYTGSCGDLIDLDFDKLDSFPQPGWGENLPHPIAKAIHMVIPNTKDKDALMGAYDFARFFTGAEQQIDWCLRTGYVPVRKSAVKTEKYLKAVKGKPYLAIPFEQSLTGTPPPIDPTRNQIYDALSIACDQVEIDNIPARDALNRAAAASQKTLDRYWHEKDKAK